MRLLALLVFLSASLFSTAQPGDDFAKSLYKAYDLTAENLFSENIEGPNVDAQGNLYVVNYQKDGTIGLVHPDGKVDLFVTLPEGSNANAIQFDAKGDMLLADWPGHNILRVNMKTKAISVFCHNDQFNQPNDICINKKGQLFASDPSWKKKTGQIWRIEPDGKSVLLLSDLGTANGIELSPDEKTLYLNVNRKILAYNVDGKGDLSNQKLIYQFEDFGMDGMKCDRDGNIYQTRHGKGTVAIISPQGKLLHEVVLKGKSCSNITFGGKDGKTCFVTMQDRKMMEMFRSEIPGKKWK